MFGNYSPAAASLSTVSSAANSPATPASPTRPSRLRGLSYLRSYTHNHLHSSSNNTATNHSNNPSATPSPARPPTLSRSTSSPARSARETPPSPPLRSDTTANGWVPTVAGQSALSRLATQPQSTHSESPTPNMTRTRAATVSQDTPAADNNPAPPVTSSTDSPATESVAAPSTQPTALEKKEAPTIRFIPHHEPRASRPSLTFPIVTRTIAAAGQRVKVGRYSERDQAADSAASAKTAAPVGFKSKVVSRRHCELWCDNGQWFIKDVKSSSGTFLNHVRLSSPGMESRAYPLNDGDIVQLGIDFKGGEEVIFRCVKIRIECNRGWQKSLNQFNTATHKNILKQAKVNNAKDSDAQSTHSSECSICLNPVAPCQALFVAPCSHVWHYKCVRTLIYPSWPSFQCPNCRAYADLEADVEPPEEEDYESEGVEDAIQASTNTQPKSPEPEPLPAIETGGLEDEDLTAMMNSVSMGSTSPSHNPSGTDSSSEGEAGPSRGSISQPVPIIASTNAPVNRTLPDSIMARSATPTSSAPFALAAATLAPMGDGQNTPMNDAGPFLFDNNPRRAAAQRSIADISREPVHEQPEEHAAP
ncbi:SMAD/FHA domain-containing protein [Aureobasidium sp. EXF-10728]|nr:SMAD/FHA domain-containing protein [Aureobasidium sp. EXF-10728]